MDADDRYLTIADLAEYSTLSDRTIRRHLTSPTRPIPHYTIGGRVLVRRSEFDAWVAANGTPERVVRARDIQQRARDAVNLVPRRRPKST
jgi:excisionase family DNA binding protein